MPYTIPSCCLGPRTGMIPGVRSASSASMCPGLPRPKGRFPNVVSKSVASMLIVKHQQNKVQHQALNNKHGEQSSFNQQEWGLIW